MRVGRGQVTDRPWKVIWISFSMMENMYKIYILKNNQLTRLETNGSFSRLTIMRAVIMEKMKTGKVWEIYLT